MSRADRQVRALRPARHRRAGAARPVPAVRRDEARRAVPRAVTVPVQVLLAVLVLVGGWAAGSLLRAGRAFRRRRAGHPWPRRRPRPTPVRRRARDGVSESRAGHARGRPGTGPQPRIARPVEDGAADATAARLLAPGGFAATGRAVAGAPQVGTAPAAPVPAPRRPRRRPPRRRRRLRRRPPPPRRAAAEPAAVPPGAPSGPVPASGPSSCDLRRLGVSAPHHHRRAATAGRWRARARLRLLLRRPWRRRSRASRRRRAPRGRRRSARRLRTARPPHLRRAARVPGDRAHDRHRRGRRHARQGALPLRRRPRRRPLRGPGGTRLQGDPPADGCGHRDGAPWHRDEGLVHASRGRRRRARARVLDRRPSAVQPGRREPGVSRRAGLHDRHARDDLDPRVVCRVHARTGWHWYGTQGENAGRWETWTATPTGVAQFLPGGAATPTPWTWGPITVPGGRGVAVTGVYGSSTGPAGVPPTAGGVRQRRDRRSGRRRRRHAVLRVPLNRGAVSATMPGPPAAGGSGITRAQDNLTAPAGPAAPRRADAAPGDRVGRAAPRLGRGHALALATPARWCTASTAPTSRTSRPPCRRRDGAEVLGSVGPRRDDAGGRPACSRRSTSSPDGDRRRRPSR